MIVGITAFVTAPTETAMVAVLLIKSTIVLSVGLLLWLLLKGAAASARHLVLGASLMAILLLPAISSLAPGIRLPLLHAPTTQVVGVSSVVTDAEPYPMTEGPVEPAARPAGQANGHPYISIVAIYYFSVLLVLGYLLVGITRVWWISRRATDITQAPGWRELQQPIVSRPLRVLLSDELNAPMTWGVLRPVIVLPATAKNWTSQDKQNALLHEYAHVERKDWLIQVLANIILSIYWFNPLVWIARRQLLLEAELAADDRVLKSGVIPDDYAAQLIALTRLTRRHRLPLAATTMAERNMLGKRVHSILNSGGKKMKLTQLGQNALVCIVAVTALLAGSVELVAAPQSSADEAVSISDDVSTPLIRAAARGNNAEVVQLLRSGVDVNGTSGNRGRNPTLPRSALTAAAQFGHLDVVRTLVEAGAPVDRVVRGDATALIEATRQNHFAITVYLLEQGADANLAVRGDGSPLIGATMANNPDAVRLLLERGADADLSVSGDENPLYHAAANGNDEILQMLIDAGVDLDQEWRGDGTALIVATRHGNTSTAEALMLAGARADQGVRGDGNAMIVAAQKGDTALLQEMIASGADVNAAVKGDGSPLIQAARNGHMEAVAMLLQAGADIDQVVAGDENALIGASWNGDTEMVSYLLRSGADPNIKAKSYGQTRTALRQATREGHDDVVRMLKAAGATE